MTNDVRDDLRGAAAIAGSGLAATAATIRDTHQAIAGRVFRLIGKPATPTRLIHDGISKTVYASVGGGLQAISYAAGHISGLVASQRQPDPASYRSLSDRRRGNAVVGALNGAWGDSFERWQNPLTIEMAPRVNGHDVPLTRSGLAAAYPDATGDVVVFVHGLCETDASWFLGARDHYGDPRSSHGSRLAAEIGVTPIYLRYNTGRHISDNGEALDQLLTKLVARWPTTIERLTLVGHSMGGLVIRSACIADGVRGQDWLPLVRRIVYLGSPHLGAPLEVAATSAALALRRLPETRPLATALASRSVGIKDLRYGDVAAADWRDLTDADARRPEPDICLPLLDSADHYYIGATLTQRQDHPVARIFGDALVTFPSASGAGPKRSLGLDVDRGRHLGGLHHFDLLNHPRVWALLRDWLVEAA